MVNSKKHLHRYLAHAEFLWNNRELEDGERLIATIKATESGRPVAGQARQLIHTSVF